MLLDEAPAKLIHDTVLSFNIHGDKNALGRINDSLSELQQARDRRLRDAEHALKKLSRQLSTLENHHAETLSSHSSADHASQILALDTQKFRVAKAATDLEIEGERLEQELETLKMRLSELEDQGVEGGEGERGRRELEDETLLRLKIYRSLGIDLESNDAGSYTKAVIRSNQKGDVHVVNIDPKFSRHFYANYFWRAM
ncbi:kinetochore-associated Ndc80 complex subunit spc24 [Trichoglossum hirsutum]|uniref:Kinetochore protein Spc24 n=1 Tax=Trichoglossum hirsutum TaxID=265104 RepID=A0A9P8RT29_9PEZI|nr:kinetochore-associated Ndc80 complex subunit spc24 [Trichoglossum hirsutum]